jgi:PAS domain S-box-containing protein
MVTANFQTFERICATASFDLYRARRLTDGMPVLLKLPPAHADGTHSARLECEYLLERSLNVAGVAKPLALIGERGGFALVLEDFAGESLGAVLGRESHMDLGVCLRIARHLADMLAGIDAARVIHRDIRPANILVVPETGEVLVVDFSLATTQEHNAVSPVDVALPVGDWAYMSPEQTGRMNRPVDYRTDCYSMGVLLYRMLTGQLPFQANDPLEWAHCHIARVPRPPGEITPEVPQPVSDIVMRLLAKLPEDRYQSAFGLRADLDRCLAQWRASGRIEPFMLGTEDVPERLQVARKLYGRDDEAAMLLGAFERLMETGHAALATVSGYSGIGKTALVDAVREPIVANRGYFISGKFDQSQRDFPYATVTQAFRELVRQLLTETEARISGWRQRIQAAVGVNGRLIVDVLPQVELIIGPQPPVSPLPPTETQNRFRMVFRQFVTAFTSVENPLILFLDDLQWVDAASLALIEHLLTHPDTQYLLLIGAYRDKEVSAAHPLMTCLESIRHSGVPVINLRLGSLSLVHLNQLVSDTLHASPGTCEPLTRLLCERTEGNPFFFIQFLDALHKEGVLRHDAPHRAWRWDLDQIKAKDFADNVIDLMVGKLRQLPVDVQQALQLAACLGNTFELRRLALVRGDSAVQARQGMSEAGVEQGLAAAERESLIVRSHGSGKFLHDRIQQAAYSLISEADRAEVHLRIGRVLLASLAADDLAEHVFDVANQFNRGTALLSERAEKAQVAVLDLRAGRLAKASSAYASACVYLAAGMALLDDSDWSSQYELMFGLWLERAECEFLAGRSDQAKQLIDELLPHAASKVDQAAVYQLKVHLHVVKSENPQAVDSALACLHLFDIKLPAHPTQEEVRVEYEAVWRSLGGRPIESLIDLPLMTNPELEAAMQVLAALHPPAFHTDVNLLCLLLCRMVNISMQHGTSGASAQAFGFLGFTLGPVFHRYREGYRFTKLACDLAEKHGFIAYHAKIYLAMEMVAVWTQPIATAIDFNRTAFRIAIETGDLTFACYSVCHACTDLLQRGDPLDAVWSESEAGLDFARKARFRDIADLIMSQQRFIATQQGRTASLSTFSDAKFDEAAFEAQLMDGRMSVLVCGYWIIKLQAQFLAGDYVSALAASQQAKPRLRALVGLIQLLDYFYYTALTVAALYENATTDEQTRWRDLLTAHREQLREWADNYPPTFADKHALVSAEIARVEGRDTDAMRLYEAAIQAARKHGFVQNEGIAHELAARFYVARGATTAGRTHFEEARNCFARWGAHGKVRQLDACTPPLREGPASRSATSPDDVEQLDLLSVVKAAQAISGQIVLEELVDTLMRIVLENAGARTGQLMLVRDESVVLAAEASVEQQTIHVRRHLNETPLGPVELATSESAWPVSIVNYALRCHERVLLDDATQSNLFSADDYVARRKPKSVLCLPLLRRSDLIGVLYLENNLATHAFTPERVMFLELLASQAAITLENACLYRDLAEREARIRRLVDANIIGIMIWDRKGRILEANDAFLSIVGYQREDLMSGRLQWTDLTPPESLAYELEQTMPQLEATGSVQPFEKEYFHKDGSLVPVLIGVAAFDEECERGVAFVVDMTEPKRVEVELRRSRHYLAEAQMVSHTGSWAWSPVSNAILYWSDECYRVMGHDPAKGLPSFEQLVADVCPDDLTRVLDSLGKAVREGLYWEAEYRLVHFDTGVRTVRSLAHPILDRSGQLIEYIGTVIDITEQKRAEQEREEHLWFLECMDRVNRAMQRTNEVEGMTRGVLEEARAIFNCDRAWLVYPCDPDAPTCRAVMEHTHPDYPGAFALDQDLTVDARTAESLSDMLHAQGVVVDLGIAPEVRERFNILSTIAIVVRPRGDKPYLFGLHQCSHARSWTCVERRLFEEIGRRLEDALTSALAHRNLLASEEALRTSEERFRTLVDHATDAIFLYDEEDMVIDVNHQASEALGYTRDELIGMRTCQFDPDLSPEKFQWIKQRLREDGSATFNARHCRKDGSLFPVEVRARTFNRGGRLFAIALASDITDRRRREQRLLAQFSVTRTLSEAGSLEEAAPRILGELCEALEWDRGTFWRVDPEAGGLVRVQTWPSDTFARTGSGLVSGTGGFGKELPWRVWSSGAPAWIPDMALDQELQREESAANDGLRAAFAFPISLRNGVLGVIEFFSRKVRDADPELMQMMTSVGSQVGQFIERTRAEDALRHAREKLVQASHMATVAELSASIAHEINQPLQAVVANGQACQRWLAATPPDIDRARLSAEAIVYDGKATADVISRIRALFKRTAPAKVELDINKLMLQVCTLMADDIHGNGISLKTQLAQDVPMIRGDAVQIQQVIVNLVRNAIEALSATTERPKLLEIRSWRDGDNLVVNVQDEGMGIANLETIFEPFTTTKETGMGMGLAICRSIVEAHGGRIWVVRNEIRGVTFSFSFPTEPSDAR